MNAKYSIQKLSSDESTLLIEENLSSNPLALPTQNGHYKLEIHQDIDDSSLSGKISHSLLFTINYPPTFSILNEYIEPGDLLILEGRHLDQNKHYQIKVDLYHDGSGFIPYEDRFIAFVPVTSKSNPGEYLLTINDPENTEIFELAFQIQEKEFPIQQLTTSSSTASIQNDNNYALMEEAFERGRANLHEEPLWDGPFLQPAEGRISTEYGVIRFTNGSESSSRHSGIDFANPLGTPTYATQNGYITLSEMINVTGNTVFIDHGFQIISQYYHLETMAVEVGDYVKKGDLIGTIGSTGFSTGPHLHFSIYSHGVYVNPWKFFEKAPF
ncbi:MAG: M23 family metallopeptidase [Vallitaleaceae bacterium]|nr:M23 family metallopeptidase [Vallitaleaceae bacterium]